MSPEHGVSFNPHYPIFRAKLNIVIIIQWGNHLVGYYYSHCIQGQLQPSVRFPLTGSQRDPAAHPPMVPQGCRRRLFLSPAHPTEPGTQLTEGGLLFGIPGTHSILLLLLTHCSSLPVMSALGVSVSSGASKHGSSFVAWHLAIPWGIKGRKENYCSWGLAGSPSSPNDC